MPHLAQATLYTPLSYALSILILPSEIQNRNEISLILFHFPKSEYIKLIKSLIVFIDNLFSVQKIIKAKIKVLKRNSYGFRNYYHFRNRIILITNCLPKTKLNSSSQKWRAFPETSARLASSPLRCSGPTFHF